MIGRLRKAHGRSVPTWLAIGLVMTMGACGWRASAHAAEPVIAVGHEAEVVELVAPYRLGEDVAEGFRLDTIQIGQRRIDFVLASRNEPAECVTVQLTVRSSAGREPGSELSVDPPDERQSPSARRAAALLKQAVARNAEDGFWRRVLSAPGAGAPPMPPPRAPSLSAVLLTVGMLLVLGATAMRSRALTRMLMPVWERWAAPTAMVASAVAVMTVVWIFGRVEPETSGRYRQVLEREFARWSLWAAIVTGAAAAMLTMVRAVAHRPRPRLMAAAALSADAVGVLAWSAVVRFVLTEPNILTDGGSGYSRLWRQSLGGWQGLSVLIEALFPGEPRFMWTIIRVPWVLAALAPLLLLVLARALGFGRARALLAGMALASLPLHAAMYSSDFEFGPLLSFDLLGLALVAAALRFDRAELSLAGAALLAYTCWGRPDAPIVGAALLAIVLPALGGWRTRPVLIAALGWFVVNAAASFANARALGVGSHLEPHLWPGFPVLRFVTLQEVVPFWLLLPLPFGVAHLLTRDPRGLAVVGLGVVAGLVPLSLSAVGHGDPTRTYLEYFRYGTWALPWIVLLAAEGMEAGVEFVARRCAGVGPGRARSAALVARATIVAACMATPLFFRSYLARQYGPRVEEGAFREALARVPDQCGLVVPDDDPDDQGGGGTIEVMRRYVYIAEEAAAQGESRVSAERMVGVSDFLRSAAEQHGIPPVPTAATPDGHRAEPACWYYFRGSYCYTGLFGRGSKSCAALERDARLAPAFTRSILYISHRLVTRPDRSDPPLYDAAQSLVLSKIVGWRTDVADAAASR